MDMNVSSIKTDPIKEPAIKQTAEETIIQQDHDKNITEGGEFLDDALRMKDQPLGEVTTNGE